MDSFFLCTGILIIVLGLLCIIIWKRNRHHRFRTKLFILFILFGTIPTITLTLITATLLTQSVQVLLPDQIAEAFHSSLDCLRTQLAEKGENFVSSYTQEKQWNSSTLSSSGIYSLYLFQIQIDTSILLRTIHSTTVDNPVETGHFSAQELRQRFSFGKSGQWIEFKNSDWFCLYHARQDSTLLAIVYPVDSKLATARHHIETALTMVNTLSLIKESILRKKLIWISAILLTVGFLSIAWMISQRLSKDMTGPIQALVNGMEHVAGGNLSYQINTRAKDEFLFLITRFNTMTHDLKQTNERLLQAEHLAAWQTVARQISHEIKNSLTPISLSLHRLKSQLDASSSKKIIESIHTIEEEIAMLKTIAAEFSDFAKLPEPVMESIQINEVIQSACHLMQNMHMHIRFHMTLLKNLPHLKADRDQMKRMFNNLLKNAVEAIQGTGDIWIKTTCIDQGRQVQIEIEDNGKGMDAQTLIRIFHPYFTTKQHGTGLGMAMVQKINEAHHGSIQIDSTPGKGTCIIIKFPIQHEL